MTAKALLLMSLATGVMAAPAVVPTTPTVVEVQSEEARRVVDLGQAFSNV